MEIPTDFNVDHLLNTNSTPSLEQRNNLQNFILQLDEDISGIKEQILVLQTRRTQLIQQRKCYSSLLSPVRCLPFEIFGQIFVYATRDCPRHVLNLSAVCQLWRDAALSTPMLWSTFELGRLTYTRNALKHIDSWIERAHSYPLSLDIRRLENTSYLVNSILTLITNHQWKSITLESREENILSILEELKFSNLEMLESFSLSTRFYLTSELSLPDALQYAPKLKTLSLNIVHCVAFDTLPFPWRQLTNLTITFLSRDNRNIGVDILQACVNLEEFIIDGEGYGSGLNGSITLKYLRKLHTHCRDNMFLLSLKTPSIQDFALKASLLTSFDQVLSYDYFA